MNHALAKQNVEALYINLEYHNILGSLITEEMHKYAILSIRYMECNSPWIVNQSFAWIQAYQLHIVWSKKGINSVLKSHVFEFNNSILAPTRWYITDLDHDHCINSIILFWMRAGVDITWMKEDWVSWCLALECLAGSCFWQLLLL